jgi:hypothetical protein
MRFASVCTAIFAATWAAATWAGIALDGPSSRPSPDADRPGTSVAARPASSAATDADTPEAKARQEALRRAQESARVRRDLAVRRRQPLEVTDMPVRDVLKLLGDIGTLNLVVDPSLQEGGIDLAVPRVTLKLTGLTYEQALLLILPREVSYKVCPGYVLITTLEKSWLPLQMQAYSITMLLAQVPDFGAQAPRFDLQALTQGASGIGQGGGALGGLFENAGGGAPAGEGPPAPEQIIDLIIRHVRHEHDRRIAPWADEGGPASVQYLNGRLIVSQTPEGHAAVQRVLWKLGA